MINSCEFEAQIGSLEQINGFLNAQLNGNHLGKDILFDLRIAIEEVFANIIAHGLNRRQTDKIGISLTHDPESIQVEVSDRGLAFNPLKIADPDLDVPPVERELGGMGIFLVKQLMDEVSYRRSEGRNILMLRKNISECRDKKE